MAPMAGSSTPPGGPGLSLAERSAQRAAERRRRLQTRFLPLALGLATAVVLLAWVSGGGHSGKGGKDAAATSSTTTTTKPPYEPPPVTPKIQPANAGEGQWSRMDPWYRADPKPASVETTTWRPDPANPSTVAYAAWMRSHTTTFALYPGYKGPGATTLNRGPMMVPESARSMLLATFNSGFYEEDSAEGFFVNNTAYFPMVDGHATAVAYKDGSVDVIAWNHGTTLPANVQMARQNLTMLVVDGHPGDGTQVGSNWGVTLGGVPAVWRTALGVDHRGNLIYVAAPNQTAASLADIMIQVGCVRAMQLDINPEWPIYVTYAGPGAAGPSLFVPNPNQIPNRFLYPSTKDFFALYTKQPKGSGQPW